MLLKAEDLTLEIILTCKSLCKKKKKVGLLKYADHPHKIKMLWD